MKIQSLFLCFFVSVVSMAQNPIIKLSDGTVEGLTNADKSVRIFKNVPFAAPPVGDLRWKAPQAVKKWLGVRQCNAFSASPIQDKPMPFMCWSEEFIAQPEPLSEDCLYLNVWTSVKTNKAKQAVFVWIYGGGLSSGSSNCAVYDGEEMAKKGIVFVSINYRVGVLGFMAHPELSKESGHNSSGNYGFLDQIAALQWVQKNIAAFGGDPTNVTIAGQSAGAFSVNALVASPLAKGLFHRAIAQSGGLLSSLKIKKDLAASEAQGLLFMQKANAISIAELRQKTAEEIQILSHKMTDRFGVTLDGYVLPIDLWQHFANRLHNDVPIMTGWVTGDGALMGGESMTAEKFKKEAQNNYGNKTETFLSVFPAQTDAQSKASQIKLGMFEFAVLPSHSLAIFSKYPAYLYHFSHVPPDKPNFPNYGAFHTSEVPYALHTLNKWQRDWQQTDRNLENTMSSYWVNFAKTGNPNGVGLPEWKNYKKQTGNIMELGDKVQLQPAFFKQELDILDTGSTFR